MPIIYGPLIDSLIQCSKHKPKTERKLRQSACTILEIVNILILLTHIACYMNSALQCLANTKFFYEYFVQQKRYMK